MSDGEITSEPEVVPESRGSGARRRWIIIAVAIAVVAVVGIGALAYHRRGSSSKGAAVTLEPAGSAGENPFANSVAVGTPPTLPDNVRAIVANLRSKLPTSKKTQTLVATGTAPGVYGGSGAAHVCDPQALITYLKQNPGNANAWAKTSGISPANIATYVRALTPVVLLNDTRVTNHGYDHAAAAPRQSVLQAGTAVMIDATGVPRVVCSSGDPLAATRPIVITKTRGKAWAGYSPKAVITIKPGALTHAFSLINVQTGAYYQQLTGNAAGLPVSVTGQWVVAEPRFVRGVVTQTVIFAISATQGWVPKAVIPGEGVSGLAYGDDKWIAVTNANNQGKGNHVLESTDLHTWKQVAALPNRLSGIAYGNGRWTATALHYTPALGATGGTHASGVIYTSADAVHWTQAASNELVANGRRQPIAYGNGEWLTVVGTDDSSSGTAVPTLVLYSSRDGQHWTANGGKISRQLSASLASGSGIWAIGSTPATVGNAVVSSSSNAVSWTPSSAGLDHGGIAAIASGHSRWMAVVTSGPPRFWSTFVVSSDAKTWTSIGRLSAPVSALAFGSTTSSNASTSTTAGSTASSGG